MATQYHSPNDYLQAALNPLADLDELNFLAKSDLPFVKIALAKHPKITYAILHSLIPTALSQHNCDLANVLIDHPLTDMDVANKIAVLLVNFPAEATSLAVKICQHPQVEFSLIRAIIMGKNVNSDFRNKVNGATTRQNVKQLLADIKNKNKKDHPLTEKTAHIPTTETSFLINPLATQMTSILKGKVLRREENQSDRDYSGGGFFWERNRAIFLYENGTFDYEDKTFQSLSSGGLSLSSPVDKVNRQSGRWTIEAYGRLVYLVLHSEGKVLLSALTDTSGPDIQILDGEPWHRYRIQ